MVLWAGAGPIRRSIVDPRGLFVFDLSSRPCPCAHPASLDLDVTLGPPIGVTAWPGATTDGCASSDERPIGSAASYQPT